MIRKGLYVSLVILLLCHRSITAFGQGKGIIFEHNLAWQAILAKAKAENKYIFVDCFATWCGPCKYMSEKIFTQKDIGDYFNVHFINVEVQMDRTLKDSETVKQWYKTASDINAQFGIVAYPTYLFLLPSGEPVDRIVGAFEAKEFIEKAKSALVPEKQYYTLIKGYKNHLNDSAYLHDAIEKALDAFDQETAAKIAEPYIDCLKNPFEKANIDLVLRVSPQYSDDLFNFLLSNCSRIDSIAGHSAEEKFIENELSEILAVERVDPLFKNKDTILHYDNISGLLFRAYPTLRTELEKFIEGRFNSGVESRVNGMLYSNSGRFTPVNWQGIGNKLRIQFPGYDCSQMIAEKKPQYYARMGLWRECEQAALALMKEYGPRMTPREINNIAWDYLFLHSSNRRSLMVALKWSKRTVELEPNEYGNLDTYANLLYKIGDRKSAAVWEKEAVEKCKMFNDEATLKEIQENLRKIEKGEKTWM